MKRSRSSEKKKINRNKEVKEKRNSGNSIVIAFVVSVLNLILTAALSVPEKNILDHVGINNSSIYLLVIGLSVLIFWGTFKQNSKILKIPLLILLIYSISVSVIPNLYFQNTEHIILLKLKIYQSLLIFSTIAIALVLMWLKREKLQKSFEEQFVESSAKFSFRSLFKKSERLYTLFFVLIVGVSVYTNFYKLDNFDLYSDEAQVTQGAAGYMYSGEYRQYSFSTKEIDTTKYYNRAKPHQYILAKTYETLGISTWTSRFPSALFGVFLVIIAYFISQLFIKDKFAALIVIFSFAFSYEFLLLQRWARMYALLLPVFFLAFRFGFRFMTEKNKFTFLKFEKYPIADNYLNYNYLMLPFFLIFFWLAFMLHMNSVILLVLFFIFSLAAIPLLKEKRYIFISILGAIILLSQFFFPLNLAYRWLTFFEVDNFQFYKYAFLGFPLSFDTNIIFVALVLFMIIISKNKQFIKNYLILVTTFFTGIILFSYVIDFSISFRYMSFLASINVILSIGAGLFVIKALFNKFLYYGLGIFMIASVLFSYQTSYNDIYITNNISPAKPSVAWKVITDNYENDELLMMHWGPSIYLNDLDSGAKIQSLYKFREENFLTVLDTLNNYKSGWLTWHTHNSGHIHADLISYANLYYKKYHGYGVDNSGVEVFYYNSDMQMPIDSLKLERNIPYANLKADNTYSIAFTIEIKDFTRGKPFYFRNIDGKEMIKVYIDKQHNLIIRYDGGKDAIKTQLPVDQEIHIVCFQESTDNGLSYGLYVNGELIQSKMLSFMPVDYIKFKVNTMFNGLINDIRIYDTVLNKNQIREVIKNKGVAGSEELFADDQSFKTLFHWQRH